MVERHGQRRVVAVSLALLVGGLVWSSFARSYLELLAAYGVVAAVGITGLYIVSYATLPAWFERRRGFTTGVASAGPGVDLVVILPGADVAIAALGGRTAMLYVAGVGASLSILIVLLFTDDQADVAAGISIEFDTGTAN